MVEEYCRILYNVGLDLKCSLSGANCVCPDKDTYEYLCYQLYLVRKATSGEMYTFKFQRNTGKIIIEHKFVMEKFCQDCDWSKQELVRIVLDDVLSEINKNKAILPSLMKTDTGLTALALTQQNGRFRSMDILFTHMVDAFRTEQFMDHFWNLSYAVMEKFQAGKDCEQLLVQLGKCMDDVNKIFEKREQTGRQIQEYCKRIYIGFERRGIYIPMHRDFYTQQCKFLDSKMNADSIEDFIFCSIDDDGKTSEYEQETVNAFINMCCVLKEYIVGFQEHRHKIDSDQYEKVVSALSVFSMKEVDISSIKGLEKVNFQTATAWRANAGIILRYFWKIKQDSCITVYH